MNNLEQVVNRAKRDIELKYVYVMMPIPQLQTLLDGLEALEKEVDKYHKLHDEGYSEMRLMQQEIEAKEDALTYAMNQIQIKESHIRKMEATHAAS